MQGKILWISFIILGLFILYNSIFERLINKNAVKESEMYHLGCFDTDQPLTNSEQIRSKIFKLKKEMNNTSSQQVKTLNKYIDAKIVSDDGGNLIAKQFQKYIKTFETIKSRNKYEQSFYNTLRHTKEQFIQCRETFNEKPWNCRNVSEEYRKTNELFAKLKYSLSLMISKKGEHISKLQSLLSDDDITKDIEYTEKYKQEIDILNQLISQKDDRIKINNGTLILITGKIQQQSITYNNTLNIIQDCHKNEHQIGYCKNLSNFVSRLYEGMDLRQLQNSIKTKRIIIDLMKGNLIQSKKLGQDTTEMEEQLQRTKRQLQQEQFLFFETNNTGKCTLEYQFICSPQNIREYKFNLTKIQKELRGLNETYHLLNSSISNDLHDKRETQLKIDELIQQLNNKAVDRDHLKLRQEKKKKELNNYKDVLNEIIIEINKINGDLKKLNQKRISQNKDIDKLMQNGQELISCIAKKELYLKLQSKTPKYNLEDHQLKNNVTNVLIERIRRSYKE